LSDEFQELRQHDSEEMARAKPLFSLENITCIRGSRMLFQNFSLSLAAGDVVQLTGRNGAGKTSCLRIISGGLKPAKGQAGWFDIPEKENDDFRISFLPADDRALKPRETARENLSFWRAVGGGGDISEALLNAGLSALADTPVRLFSAGQKRRLSLARIYMSPARLWLLDEPLNGLDADAAADFAAALQSHAAAGGMAVVAGHQPVAGARLVAIGDGV
jgi:heme exporter protein A